MQICEIKALARLIDGRGSEREIEEQGRRESRVRTHRSRQREEIRETIEGMLV